MTDITNNRPKILVLSRWIDLPKGFSRILSDLYSTYLWQKDFDVCHYAWHRPTSLKDELERFNIITMSASNDNRLLNIIETIKPEIILAVGDIKNIEAYKNILASYNGIKIAYIFIDGTNIPYTWNETLRTFDYIVSATEFGKEELLKSEWNKNINTENKNNIRVINPPLDRSTFKTISNEKRNKYRNLMNLDSNDFLMTYITINSVRKGIELSLELLEKTQKETKGSGKKIKLLLHTETNQALINSIKYFDLEENSVILSSNEISTEHLARYYQLSDLCINTSLSEGWGMPNTESMACGTYALAPNHSGLKGALGAESKSKINNIKRESLFLYPVLNHNEYLYNSDCIIFVKRPDIKACAKKIKKHIEKLNNPTYINDLKTEMNNRCNEIDKHSIAKEWLGLFTESLTLLNESNRNLNKLSIPRTTFHKC